MVPGTQEAGYYVWEVPGKSVTIHLHLDVVDRLSAEVMRGFGAVPKRGAEVGGVLIGTIEPGEASVVRIEDFEPLDCDYKRGPSYLFSGADEAAFDAACKRWRQDASPGAYAVGYFRSHTRDGMELAAEDIELMDRCFPDASNVALIVKPFATKASPAGFFFRENGTFQAATPLEFPFRRRELGGEEPPPHRSMMERKPRSRDLRASAPLAVQEDVHQSEAYQSEPYDQEGEYLEAESIPQSQHAYATLAPRSGKRGGWVWIPLSFIFLLLGVLLGFQAALTLGPRSSANSSTDFSLSLGVAKSGENLNIKWEPKAAAIRGAQRGVIEITDAGQTITRELDAAQLQNGNMTYHNSSNSVRVRLTVNPTPRTSLAETVDWKQ